VTQKKMIVKHSGKTGNRADYKLPSIDLLDDTSAPDYRGYYSAKDQRNAYLREFAEDAGFCSQDVILPLALGKDSAGRLVTVDLAEMPHLLVAGACGTGKCICILSLLNGLLLSRTPDQLRLILVDIKTFEYPAYSDIKHLMMPVLNDIQEATSGFRWAVDEMNKRYELFKIAKVSDIREYNARPINKNSQPPERLPYIVIVVDDLADVSSAQSEIEPCIVRLAQFSRASGIHMILATQRPSVNVITGTIKANIPGRIAFQVAQGNDSRTILDALGAEKLFGKGDMLYLPPGKNEPVRLQGTYTGEGEKHRIANFIRTQGL